MRPILNIMGTLGKDWEIKETTSHTFYKNTLACSWKYNGKKETQWIKLTAFNKTGEVLNNFTAKGCRIHLSGPINVEAWLDKSNAIQKALSMIVQEFEIIEYKKKSENKEDYEKEERKAIQEELKDVSHVNMEPVDETFDDLPF